MADLREYPHLPDGFVFGASTASYQVEGAVDEDGRGPSVWDRFCAEPGRIADGSSGAVACDHYHRYPEDVALMKGLGLDAYRFSISWSRIQPEGRGRANAAGLAFYDRLLDELLESGIAPMATLFHWDLPQPLEDDGGWLNRETAERFAEYATLVGMRFADRVAHWVPVNEPNVVTMLGYGLGRHAPGKRLMFDALPAAHHLLLGHGRAVQALRAVNGKSIGTATNHTPVLAASDSAEDKEAAASYATLWNRLFSDPVLRGSYPVGFDALMPGPVEDDLRTIGTPVDFYGVNYYNPTRVAGPSTPAPPEAPERLDGLPFVVLPVEGYPRTDFGWPVVPGGLRDLLVMMEHEYDGLLPPVFVTENGCAYDDAPDAAGRVDDRRRIEYLDGHLRAVGEAIAAGVDVRGYFTWSLLDNFEWAEGYTKRFGLVHVDFETQRRTPKDSYAWFARMVAENRTSPEG
ncbi:beta-glucosidase [Nocardioides sp. WL0053]|uniref:Beta-glucosidase n=1 Tax=Nocardioides jiangsuensis TaxID=2866161 RepID=A0ABS7RGD6_9ACTN|nr:GH1 family beta-glucosidase [Nocardioides jiangsuensis]MBY9074102.1 beta-glucosidase [Nocardioides jiangsuensis]